MRRGFSHVAIGLGKVGDIGVSRWTMSNRLARISALKRFHTSRSKGEIARISHRNGGRPTHAVSAAEKRRELVQGSRDIFVVDKFDRSGAEAGTLDVFLVSDVGRNDDFHLVGEGLRGLIPNDRRRGPIRIAQSSASMSTRIFASPDF